MSFVATNIRRLLIAKTIHECGPMKPFHIARELELSNHEVFYLLYRSPAFARLANGRYELSEVGTELVRRYLVGGAS